MTRTKLVFIFIVLSFTAFYYVMTTTTRTATTLFVNGKVYTLDENNSVHEALAIRGSRVAGVGSSDELRKRFVAERIIDLEGKTVLPGLVDGHAHMLGEGDRLNNLDLTGTTSAAQIVDLVARRVQQTAASQWIFGRGWDQNDWEIKEFPGHDILDRIAPNHPVLLTRIDGHAVWANRKAMDLAGVSVEANDVEGGKIYRDQNGRPTGIFVDNAVDLITKVVPNLTDAEVEERLKLALHECAEFGLTEVHDMGVDLRTLNIYKRLIDSGACPIRVYAVIGGPGETWDAYRRSGKEIGYGAGMLTVRAIKLYMDGALGSRGAALIDEYSDDPGNRGLTLTSEKETEDICQQAVEKGFQVCTHAIGDRGNNITLNAYEQILSGLPKDAPPPRWRIEHAQVLTRKDIPRFAKVGIIPSMQPTHATSDMYWVETRLGRERVKGAYAWRSLIEAGSIIIGGSDFPVEGVNPLWGFYAAVSRSDKSGYPQDGWYAQEKMTREEAARCFTSWPAYGSFEELTRGTLEPGKDADITIISKDIMKVPTAEILSAQVEMTIVGGKIVYEKQPAALPTQ